MPAETNMFPSTKITIEQVKHLKCPYKRQQIKVTVGKQSGKVIYRSILAGTAFVVSVFETMLR